MKDYKLSEIRDFCKQQQKKDIGCYHCEMMEVCRKFYLAIPYTMEIDGEDKNDELQAERD